ncbi:hypothetical protein GCM10023176_55790 [Micromonospora coerulea]|uniref:Uncharacterized protein n=1 Tax=Micromonospora coerulea TaxID=47856 RepID=A0ABP8T052_9ACTN
MAWAAFGKSIPEETDTIFRVRISRAAVAAAGAAVCVGDCPPGQGGQLGAQVGRVALHGENPVGATLGEVGDVVALTVQGVGGHHDLAEVAELVEQGCEAGDLVGLAVDVGAGQHDTSGLVGGGEDVRGDTVAGRGAA